MYARAVLRVVVWIAFCVMRGMRWMHMFVRMRVRLCLLRGLYACSCAYELPGFKSGCACLFSLCAYIIIKVSWSPHKHDVCCFYSKRNEHRRKFTKLAHASVKWLHFCYLLTFVRGTAFCKIFAAVCGFWSIGALVHVVIGNVHIHSIITASKVYCWETWVWNHVHDILQLEWSLDFPLILIS